MSLLQDKLPLRVLTPPGWIQAVLADFESFLQDHANCERKASALAMSFVAKYPDRTALTEPMISLAKEEWTHFHEVYKLLHSRGSGLTLDEKDPYVSAMLSQVRHGRDEHFLDRLLISAVIEARGCERFAIVATADLDEDLKGFYRRLAREEAGHYTVFVRIARHYFSEAEASERLNQLLDWEAKAMLSVPHRAAVH